MPGMSPRTKSRKGRFGPGGINPPTVTITSPSSGFPATTAVPFPATGVANDDLLGDISSTIQWVSDLDGPLGIGASVMLTLTTLGAHNISATVTDGVTPAVDNITVIVGP